MKCRLLFALVAAALWSAPAPVAQTKPATTGGAPVTTPRMPDGKPDLNGRWGGGGAGAGGAGGVQAIEPDGRVHQFEHYAEYSEALAA